MYFNQLINQSILPFSSLSIDLLVKQSIYLSVNPSTNKSINQSSNHLFIQPINLSINRSFDQSCFQTFYLCIYQLQSIFPSLNQSQAPPGLVDDPVIVAFLVETTAHALQLGGFFGIRGVNGELSQNVGPRRIVNVQIMRQSSSETDKLQLNDEQ